MERYRDFIPDFEAFQQTIREPQPHDFRVNTLKADVEEVRHWMEAHGYTAEQLSWNDRFFRADFEPGRTMLQWLGKIYVQESVSGIPPLALDPQPGERVLDLC
ncbi:MAG: hypothetical protein SVU32_09705, partial [Candidatus Nanohaloarchaea archaeon]|nr:hypothetical protein [Candidatus Nanohaloarchaea archaeon]